MRTSICLTTRNQKI